MENKSEEIVQKAEQRNEKMDTQKLRDMKDKIMRQCNIYLITIPA